MTIRRITQIIPSVATQDGAGVRLRRSLGARQGQRLDPFLMLDEFSSDDPDDYIAGFPAHPHRGFETVTYILDGHMLHEDHLGNRGDLRSGGVQWMRAGRGIIHSEMPQQTEGRLRGFQLWINLPARDKMSPPSYRDIQAEDIPQWRCESGAVVRIIGGAISEGAERITGAISDQATDWHFLDIRIPAGASFSQPVPPAYNAFLYLVDGEASVDGREIPRHAAAVLEREGELLVRAGEQDAHLLALYARPIGEPIVQYGPFVMNTSAEIEQALRDYRDGKLVQPGP